LVFVRGLQHDLFDSKEKGRACFAGLILKTRNYQ